MKPLALILLLGVGIVAVWDSVYQVGPDELVFVSRFGKTERMESSPGLKVKVPFVEKTDTQPRQASFTTRGDGVFLTSDKKSLALGYEFRWRIVDAERFQRTIASQTRRADRMLEHAAENSLRNELIGLRGTDLDLLREAERLRFSVDEKTPLIAPLGAVIGDVNSRINEIGIAVNDWELSVATRER